MRGMAPTAYRPHDLPRRPSHLSLLAPGFSQLALLTILLAFIIRLVLCLQPACIGRDGVHFVSFARQLADDPVKWLKVTTKQPGYAYLVLGTQRLLGPRFGGDQILVWQRCGELLALIGGVFACVGIIVLTRRLFDDRTALTAGVLAAFWPHGAHLSAQVLSDMPHLGLYLSGLLISHRALIKPHNWALPACGLVAGLAYMVRQEALGLIPAVAFCWLWRGPERSSMKKWAGVALMLACFAAVVAPYSIATGTIMPNKSLGDLLDKLPLGMSAPKGAPLLIGHVTPFWQTPVRMAEAWGKSGRYVLSTLFLIALFSKTLPRSERRGRRLVAAAAGFHVVLLMLRVGVYGEISSRYMVIPVALSLPWAAAGLRHVLAYLTLRCDIVTRRRTAVLWAAGFTVALAPMIYYDAIPVYHGKEHLRSAGEWLRQRARPEEVILAHEHLEQIMFYADRIYPNDTWVRSARGTTVEQIRELILFHHPAWYVDAEGSRRDTAHEKRLFTAFAGGAIPELVPAHIEGPPGRRIHVYRIEPSAPDR